MRTLSSLAAIIIFVATGSLATAHAQTAGTDPVRFRDPPSPDTSKPVRVSGGVMAGQRFKAVQPEFPAEARARHINGAVVFHVVIGKDGHIKELTPVSGPPILYDAYAKAVRQWAYYPWLMNGEPYEVDTTVTLNLQVNGQPAFPSSAATIHISGGEMNALLEHRVEPVGPEGDMMAHVTGTIVLHAIISPDGRVQNLQVISGPQLLRSAAVNAVRQWRYRPYLLNGMPAAVDTTISITLTSGDPGTGVH